MTQIAQHASVSQMWRISTEIPNTFAAKKVYCLRFFLCILSMQSENNSLWNEAHGDLFVLNKIGRAHFWAA